MEPLGQDPQNKHPRTHTHTRTRHVHPNIKVSASSTSSPLYPYITQTRLICSGPSTKTYKSPVNTHHKLLPNLNTPCYKPQTDSEAMMQFSLAWLLCQMVRGPKEWQ